MPVLNSLALRSHAANQPSELDGGRALRLGGALDCAVDCGLALDGRVSAGLLLDAVFSGHEGSIATLAFELVYLFNL